MFLTPTNLVHYLLARGHLDAGSIVDGDFIAHDLGRRNRNFLVRRKRGDGLFVKQSRTFGDFDTATLRREAACYQLAQADDALAPLARLMPRWLDYDAARHCLVVALLEGMTLSDYQRQHNAFPEALARQLGDGLGTYHSRCGDLLAERADASTFPRQLPWILRLHRAGELTPGTSTGILQLVQVLRSRPELTTPLDRLAAGWRTDSLIHGDMKWDNCIVVEPSSAEGDPQLRFVDWELADIGDADWDVGAILQAYLSCWILSMQVQPGADLSLSAARAHYRLDRLQPAVRAFWHAYCDARGWHVESARPRLLRALSYGAARLLQTAYEYLQPMPHLTGHSALLLQTSANILQQPDRAAADLLTL